MTVVAPRRLCPDCLCEPEQMYVAECPSCGWWGDPRTTEDEADVDAVLHDASHHGGSKSGDSR